MIDKKKKKFGMKLCVCVFGMNSLPLLFFVVFFLTKKEIEDHRHTHDLNISCRTLGYYFKC